MREEVGEEENQMFLASASTTLLTSPHTSPRPEKTRTMISISSASAHGSKYKFSQLRLAGFVCVMHHNEYKRTTPFYIG